MKFRILVFTLLSVCSLFPQSQSDTSQIVASVGNENITFGTYLARYEDYLIFSGIQDNQQARFAVLNNMINEILLKSYDDNSAIYNNYEFNKEKEWARKETVLAFLKDREVYAKITASDDELKIAYIRSKVKIAVRHLYAATEKEAENLYQLVRMGVSFNELAKQCFTDTALKNNGGYLGYINWGSTDPNFENAAYSMRVGEISRPVKTAQGYSIIKVEDIVQNPFKTQDEFLRMKEKLERAVRISKKIPSEEAYLNQIFNKSDVIFNEIALSAILNDLKETNFNSSNIESNNQIKTIKDCVKYKDKLYSAKEIENKIFEVPKYNRDLLTDLKTLKQAVLALVMQDVLLGIADEKGYDTTSYVNESYAKLENNIYLNYKRSEVLATVPVSDSEIVKYYKDNIAQYSTEREIDVQEIILDNDSTANAIVKKINSGEDFGNLAEKYSLRIWSAKNKGEMGYSQLSNFGDMKDTLWDSPLGKLFGPIRFDKYYGVFRVLGKKDVEPIEISLVKQEIIKNIENEKGFPYMKKRLENLSKKTTIKVNDDLVKNYVINLAG
jgi:parvulin-like peptidyl-prolyl isomerase